MEYVFGTKDDSEYVCVKGESPRISGFVTVVEEHDDCAIRHTFRVGDAIKLGERSAWYYIDNHVTAIDRNRELERRLQEQSDALVELAELIGG